MRKKSKRKNNKKSIFFYSKNPTTINKILSEGNFMLNSRPIISVFDTFLFTKNYSLANYLPKNYDSFLFRDKLKKCKNKTQFISFKSKTGKNLLIVPCITNNKTNYSHLNIFLRTATKTQKKALWQEILKQSKILLKNCKKIIIYTHGLQVPFLHVKLKCIKKKSKRRKSRRK